MCSMKEQVTSGCNFHCELKLSSFISARDRLPPPLVIPAWQDAVPSDPRDRVLGAAYAGHTLPFATSRGRHHGTKLIRY